MVFKSRVKLSGPAMLPQRREIYNIPRYFRISGDQLEQRSLSVRWIFIVQVILSDNSEQFSLKFLFLYDEFSSSGPSCGLPTANV